MKIVNYFDTNGNITLIITIENKKISAVRHFNDKEILVKDFRIDDFTVFGKTCKMLYLFLEGEETFNYNEGGWKLDDIGLTGLVDYKIWDKGEIKNGSICNLW